MTNDYIEAILIWSEKGSSTLVNDWFIKQGLVVTSMRKGLLISGGQSIFENVFQIKQIQSNLPLVLPIPDDLAEHVSSITIPKPRELSTK